MAILRYILKGVICLILTGYAEPTLPGEGIVIIANRSVPAKTMSFQTIKLIYLRKSMMDDKGNLWQPVNLPIPHPIRQQFSDAMFKQQPEQQETYWNKLYFQGVNPPIVEKSEEAVLRFVALTPNAIGYVRENLVDKHDDVIKLLVLPIHLWFFAN